MENINAATYLMQSITSNQEVFKSQHCSTASCSSTVITVSSEQSNGSSYKHFSTPCENKTIAVNLTSSRRAACTIVAVKGIF